MTRDELDTAVDTWNEGNPGWRWSLGYYPKGIVFEESGAYQLRIRHLASTASWIAEVSEDFTDDAIMSAADLIGILTDDGQEETREMMQDGARAIHTLFQLALA